jgi:CheY-like chemotaxis protein
MNSANFREMSVLYVDDDAEDAEVFCEAIQTVDAGIICTVFTDHVDVLNEIANSCPDFIFLDYKMPKVNGVQILHNIQKTECYGRAKIIMYSSFMREREIEECRKLGAHDCLKKSSDFLGLCDSLRTLLS